MVQQSKHWVEAGGSSPKKTIAFIENVTACVIILIDYLENGKTITNEYNAHLSQLDEKLLRSGLDCYRKIHIPLRQYTCS